MGKGGPCLEMDFVGHACLKITHGDTSLLTDPWIEGPAYEDQWYLYPQPDRSIPLDDVRFIQYTHGHEDHLHEPTFPLLPKDATVLLTKQWHAGNDEWLRENGFGDVREITSGRWVQLSKGLELVSFVNRSDSLSVLRTPDEVLVNCNDALHAYDDDCIDFYCRRIQRAIGNRPVDYLFCGFGGASYFPNCLRHEDKDDHAVARAREAHFARGFARVVANLKPRMAFAFAAGLVLLEPHNHWINAIKLHNDPLAAVNETMPEMQGRVYKLRPGDRIAGGAFVRGSQPVPEDPIADYQRLYAEEIRAKAKRPMATAERAGELFERIETNFRERLARMRRNKLESDKMDFDWAIQLMDRPEAILRLTRSGADLTASRISPDELADVRDMVVVSNSRVLDACVSALWGGDALQIGYGGIFELRSDLSVDANHSRMFLKFGTKLPLQSDYLMLHPLRGVSHLMHSPYLARQAARMVLRRSDGVVADAAGKEQLTQSRHWIEAGPCEGCPVCDLVPDERFTRGKTEAADRLDEASHLDGPSSA